jgi:hypothetical protein
MITKLPVPMATINKLVTALDVIAKYAKTNPPATAGFNLIGMIAAGTVSETAADVAAIKAAAAAA